MKYLKNILFLLFSTIYYVGFAQMGNFTNVDTIFLKPAFMKRNLDVRFFRNGDPIYESKTIEEFYQTELETKPSYFVKYDGNKSHYFYNWWAIYDNRSIAPFGFIVPSPTHFKSYSLDELIEVHSIGYIDIDEFIDDENILLLWTNSKSKDSSNYADAFLFDKLSMITHYNYPMNCAAGLTIRCIEDLETSIKDSVFDYKKLLPDVYTSELDKMYQKVRSKFGVKESFLISCSMSIGCSKTGNISYSLGRIEQLRGGADEEKLKKTLNSTLAEWNTVPYYQGNILMANSDMQLTFKREVKPSKKSSLFKLYNLGSHTVDTNLLFTAYSNGFKCKTSTESIVITDNKEIVKQQTTTSVYEFKAPSLYNTAFFVIPGLGLTTTHRNSESDKWKKIGKSFLISSISIGAISLSSKIYSNIYYSRYRYNPTGVNANSDYKKANISQKVFLSTLGTYALLGAMDFTFTFGIGLKNKKYQKDLKKELDAGREVILK